MSLVTPGQPAFVDDAAQGTEQPRRSMYLVENHEPIGRLGAVLFDVTDLGQIARQLQIDVDGAALASNLPSQRGLADLARPNQHDRRMLVQALVKFVLEVPLNHLCKYNSKSFIYIVYSLAQKRTLRPIWARRVSPRPLRSAPSKLNNSELKAGST